MGKPVCMTLELIHLLFEYNLWANQRVWACAQILADSHYCDGFGFSVGSVHAQLFHTMSIEWYWFKALHEGLQPTNQYTLEDYPTPRALRAEWDQLNVAHLGYIKEWDDTHLRTRIPMDAGYTLPFSEIFLHLINHSTDHRAHTLAAIHHFGGSGVEQDLLFYGMEQHR